MKHKNIGKFKVAWNLIENKIDVMQKIFCECVAIETTHTFLTNEIIYTAISNHFREIKKNEKIPWYDCNITIYDDKKVKIKFEEINIYK